MAQQVGVSPATVQRVWREHRLYPHRVSTFTVSKDPQFLETLTAVVGLYMNPPDNAAVLCIDKKTMIQALDRTQPGLPLKRGKAGTMIHDYKRHGTIDLFAALNILDGEMAGQCTPRHRHPEFLQFLRKLDRKVPKTIDLQPGDGRLLHPLRGERARLAGRASPVLAPLCTHQLVVGQPS
jgi:hypothetical protein